jgi:hypothetical protein
MISKLLPRRVIVMTRLELTKFRVKDDVCNGRNLEKYQADDEDVPGLAVLDGKLDESDPFSGLLIHEIVAVVRKPSLSNVGHFPDYE